MTTRSLDPIQAIDEAHIQGVDTWEAMVALGASDEEEMAVRRWRHGDLAMRVEKRYGDKTLSRFASEIGIKYPTLKQRWQMSNFYQPDTRYLFENVGYSHYREAMKLGSMERALWALEKASRRDWPVWKFAELLSRLQGKRHKTSNKFDAIIQSLEGKSLLLQIGDKYFRPENLLASVPFELGQTVTITIPLTQ